MAIKFSGRGSAVEGWPVLSSVILVSVTSLLFYSLGCSHLSGI